jgi:ankyrin repeat protein
MDEFDPFVINKYGETLLHIVVKKVTDTTPLIVEELLKIGLDPNAQGLNNNFTPLHYLINYSFVPHPHCKSKDCIHCKEYIDIIKQIIDLLLLYGADINAHSTNKKLRVNKCTDIVSYGMTAYMCGIMSQKDNRILDYLKEKGSTFDHIKKEYH